MLENTFAISNFNYCFLVWNLCSAQFLNKIENLQKRALGFLLNDYDSNQENVLEEIVNQNMNLRRQKRLRIENKLNQIKSRL